MYSISKKISILILAITSVIFSRIIFLFIDDPEGPNLLVVTGMALILFLLSLSAYLFKITTTKKLLASILIQVIIVTGFYFFFTRQYVNNTDIILDNGAKPVFAWKFETAELLNLDGIAKTNIYLEAKYSDETIKKLIDVVDGGCNELLESDKDSVLNSTNIQCYYAGLGFRYKIMEGDKSYQVLRRTFEEGTGEYTPPTFDYEVISEFPLQ